MKNDIKEIEKVDIISSSLLNVNQIDIISWLGALTDLEQKVLSVLFQKNKSTTIKDVRANLVVATYFKNIENMKFDDFPFESYYYISDEIKHKVKQKENPKSRIDELKKVYSFPSFERIDKVIQRLVQLKIVIERKEGLSDKKIKGLYFLNPILRTALNKESKKS